MTIELLHIDCMEPQKSKGGFKKGHKLQSWLGKKHSPETKQKMREARLKNQPMHKPEVVTKRSETLKARGSFAKENSNNWKGGVTSEQILARNSLESKQWRLAVFARDGHQCQECGAKCGNGKGVHLHAHHIKSFAHHPELRFDISNGVTLCKECHYKAHAHAKH